LSRRSQIECVLSTVVWFLKQKRDKTRILKRYFIAEATSILWSRGSSSELWVFFYREWGES
jgi:hypothetical protein